MISIVLLTKNGGPLFQNVIIQLQNQVSPLPVEIVVVDSGSTDGTLEFLETHGVRVFRVPEREFSFGPVRQFAFAQTQGDIIVTLSQDVLPFDQNYIVQLVTPILQDEADVVQGRTLPPSSPDIFYWERAHMFYFTSEGAVFASHNQGIKLSCCSLAMTRTAWGLTGFGQTPYCEDKYIQVRLHTLGFRFKKLETPNAWHGHSYSLITLAKRCHNEGVGWRYAGVRYSVRSFVSDLFVSPWRFREEMREWLKLDRTHNMAELLFFQVRPVFFLIGNRLSCRYWA